MLKIVKRPILLLEVLIALALVALCAFPLLAPQIMIIRLERQFLAEIEADRVANVIFVNLVKRMYQNNISWEQLQSTQEYPVDKDLLEGVSLPSNWPYKMSYRFKKAFSKPPNQPPQFLLMEVWLVMAPAQGEPLYFFYELFVEKDQTEVPKESENEEE